MNLQFCDSFLCSVCDPVYQTGVENRDTMTRYTGNDTHYTCANNISYTITSDDLFFFIYYFTFMAIISLVGLLGNGIVIHCVIFQRNLREPVNYFLFSLACSDFLLCVVYPVYNISHMEDCAIIDTLGKNHYVCIVCVCCEHC